MNVLVTTKRSSLRWLLDLVLTALGWIAFFYLFVAGIMAILRDEMRGPDAPLLSEELLASVGTVLSYLLLTTVFTVILITWAKYNQYRFSGKDRRKRAAAVSEEKLCASLQVSTTQFHQAQTAPVMVVHHNEAGLINDIEVLSRQAAPVQEPVAEVPLVQEDSVQASLAEAPPVQEAPAQAPRVEQKPSKYGQAQYGQPAVRFSLNLPNRNPTAFGHVVS